jgi:hypothetical protein
MSALHPSTTITIGHLRNGATEAINNTDSHCSRIVRNEKDCSFGVRKQSERWAKLLQPTFRTILTNPVTRPTLYIKNTPIIQEITILFRALLERSMGKARLRLKTGTWQNLVTYLLLKLPVFITFWSTTPHECQIQLVSFLQSYTYSLVWNYILQEMDAISSYAFCSNRSLMLSTFHNTQIKTITVSDYSDGLLMCQSKKGTLINTISEKSGGVIIWI